MAATVQSFGPELSISIAGTEATDERPELFRFRFGKGPIEAGPANTFRIHIDPEGYTVRDEVWRTSGDVATDVDNGIACAACRDHLAVHAEWPVAENDDFAGLTHEAYATMLEVVRRRGYPNLARAWNYFPGINAGDGDSERYRQFTAGRAAAFQKFDYTNDDLPAGTAIGTDIGTPLSVTLLATRGQCRRVENPRQISAFEYPRQYGPASPTFSRAVVVDAQGRHKILISGTASIVGHESQHFGDASGQLGETLRNLDELIAQAVRDVPSGAAGNAYWRAYVRRSELSPLVERSLREHSGASDNVIILRGDICRRELQVEIEAACEA